MMNQRIVQLLLLVILCYCVIAKNTQVWDYSQQKGRPLIIAHRGLSSHIPENTLEAFEAGLYAGADFVELDVQITKQGVLVVSHDPYLSRQTNIANKTQFASRKRNFTYQDNLKEDWWVWDFTIEELKTLGIRQSLVPNRPTLLDYQVTFPTLQEVLQMTINFNALHKGNRNPEKRLGGVLIEAKDCDVYRSTRGVQQGLLILNLLQKYDLHTMEASGKKAPIMLHSFDSDTVQLWHQATPTLPNSLLAVNQWSMQSFNETAKYARIAGLEISGFYNNTRHRSTNLINEMHKAGLMAHAWTFRDDQQSWNVKQMYDQYQIAMKLGLDGIITQFPEAAVNVIQIMKNSVEGKIYWGLHEKQIQKAKVAQNKQLGFLRKGEETEELWDEEEEVEEVVEVNDIVNQVQEANSVQNNNQNDHTATSDHQQITTKIEQENKLTEN